MSSKAYADRLARALEATGLAQAVNSTYGESQVRVLCRVLPGKDDEWVGLVRRLLLATEIEQGRPYSWQAHICRLYFLKEKKLVFGWNVSIQSLDMSTSLDYLNRVVRGEDPGTLSKVRAGELEEMEFTGVTGDRLPTPLGKGAYTVGGKSDFRISRPGGEVK
jgi:hypothetical protein